MHLTVQTRRPSGITVTRATFTSVALSCTQSTPAPTAAATHWSVTCVVVCRETAMSLLLIFRSVITVVLRHLGRSLKLIGVFQLQAAQCSQPAGIVHVVRYVNLTNFSAVVPLLLHLLHLICKTRTSGTWWCIATCGLPWWRQCYIFSIMYQSSFVLSHFPHFCHVRVKSASSSSLVLTLEWPELCQINERHVAVSDTSFTLQINCNAAVQNTATQKQLRSKLCPILDCWTIGPCKIRGWIGQLSEWIFQLQPMSQHFKYFWHGSQEVVKENIVHQQNINPLSVISSITYQLSHCLSPLKDSCDMFYDHAEVHFPEHFVLHFGWIRIMQHVGHRGHILHYLYLFIYICVLLYLYCICTSNSEGCLYV